MPRKKKTTKQFIEEAKKVHGNKYDYSKVKYNGNHNKIRIICPILSTLISVTNIILPNANIRKKKIETTKHSLNF